MWARALRATREELLGAKKINRLHGCTAMTHTALRKLYFHLSNMAGLYVAAERNEGVCEGEREKGDGVNLAVVGFQTAGGRA